MNKRNAIFQVVKHGSTVAVAMAIVVLILGNTIFSGNLIDSTEDLVELVDLDEQDQENEDGENDAKEAKKLEDKAFTVSVKHSFIDLHPTNSTKCLLYWQNLHQPIPTPPPDIFV